MKNFALGFVLTNASELTLTRWVGKFSCRSRSRQRRVPQEVARLNHRSRLCRGFKLVMFNVRSHGRSYQFTVADCRARFLFGTAKQFAMRRIQKWLFYD